nr:MAG TPA: hypothetical protein [Caudoviricetes sp.]
MTVELNCTIIYLYPGRGMQGHNAPNTFYHNVAKKSTLRRF